MHATQKKIVFWIIITFDVARRNIPGTVIISDFYVMARNLPICLRWLNNTQTLAGGLHRLIELVSDSKDP